MAENQYKPWEAEGIAEAGYWQKAYLRERQRIRKLRTLWDEYGLYLRQKYPKEDGRPWQFGAIQRRIDDILREGD